MQVEVLLFAGAADAAGTRRLTRELPEGSCVGDLAAVLRDHPGLAGYLDSAAWAVNEEYAKADAALADGDVVAVIPPVSGGAGHLTTAPVDVGALLATVADGDHGGTTLFLGTVREHTDDAVTRAIEYEAYEPMADKEIGNVLAAAAARWPEARLAAVHRLGHLDVGDVSVAVAASAPHRQEAFAACRFVIDGIKATVPVWKKEIAPDGSGQWVHCAHDDDNHDVARVHEEATR